MRLLHLALRLGEHPPGTLMLLVDDERVILLDGTSAPIHELNATRALKCDAETAIGYLRFFCFVVRGEEGPFVILEPPVEPRPAAVPDEPEYEPGVTAQAQPIQALGFDEDRRFRYGAIVAYGSGLFHAVFAVDREGPIEM